MGLFVISNHPNYGYAMEEKSKACIPLEIALVLGTLHKRN